jgi:hypothetical protein
MDTNEMLALHNYNKICGS